MESPSPTYSNSTRYDCTSDSGADDGSDFLDDEIVGPKPLPSQREAVTPTPSTSDCLTPEQIQIPNSASATVVNRLDMLTVMEKLNVKAGLALNEEFFDVPQEVREILDKYFTSFVNSTLFLGLVEESRILEKASKIICKQTDYAGIQTRKDGEYILSFHHDAKKNNEVQHEPRKSNKRKHADSQSEDELSIKNIDCNYDNAIPVAATNLDCDYDNPIPVAAANLDCDYDNPIPVAAANCDYENAIPIAGELVEEVNVDCITASPWPWRHRNQKRRKVGRKISSWQQAHGDDECTSDTNVNGNPVNQNDTSASEEFFREANSWIDRMKIVLEVQESQPPFDVKQRSHQILQQIRFVGKKMELEEKSRLTQREETNVFDGQQETYAEDDNSNYSDDDDATPHEKSFGYYSMSDRSRLSRCSEWSASIGNDAFATDSSGKELASIPIESVFSDLKLEDINGENVAKNFLCTLHLLQEKQIVLQHSDFISESSIATLENMNDEEAENRQTAKRIASSSCVRMLEDAIYISVPINDVRLDEVTGVVVPPDVLGDDAEDEGLQEDINSQMSNFVESSCNHYVGNLSGSRRKKGKLSTT